MIRRITAGLTAFVVSALVLAGCTQPADPEPSPTPSVSAVASPTPAPSPTPTVTEEERLLGMIPDAAKGDDLPAAVEMAKFFLLLQPDLYRGGDSALWVFLSLDECMFCSTTVTSTSKRVEDGHLQEGGEYRVPEQVVTSVLAPEDDGSFTALVGFRFTEDPYEIVARDGTVMKSGGFREWQAAMGLRYVDGLWRVSGVALD